MGIFDANQTGTHTTTQRRVQPDWITQALQQGVGQAGAYNQNFQSNPYTTGGLNALGALAGQMEPGPRGFNAAFDQYRSTLWGDQLDTATGAHPLYESPYAGRTGVMQDIQNIGGSGTPYGAPAIDFAEGEYQAPKFAGAWGLLGPALGHQKGVGGVGFDERLPGTDVLQQAVQEPYLQSGVGFNQSLPGTEALQETAAGDYLYGGQGFNAALDAAANRIQPRVASAFGRAGQSGAPLAQAAMTQELGDAFAAQYGQERGRQMQSAGYLGDAYRDAQARQLGASEYLGDTFRGAQERQLEAATTLGQMYSGERNRQLTADDMMRRDWGQERNRQLQALGMAPQMAELSAFPGELQYQVGQRIDQEPERQIDDYIRRITDIGRITESDTEINSPLYGNDLAGLLGLGTSGVGLLQEIFGSGESGDGGGSLFDRIRKALGLDAGDDDGTSTPPPGEPTDDLPPVGTGGDGSTTTLPPFNPIDAAEAAAKLLPGSGAPFVPAEAAADVAGLIPGVGTPGVGAGASFAPGAAAADVAGLIPGAGTVAQTGLAGGGVPAAEIGATAWMNGPGGLALGAALPVAFAAFGALNSDPAGPKWDAAVGRMMDAGTWVPNEQQGGFDRNIVPGTLSLPIHDPQFGPMNLNLVLPNFAGGGLNSEGMAEMNGELARHGIKPYQTGFIPAVGLPPQLQGYVYDPREGRLVSFGRTPAGTREAQWNINAGGGNPPPPTSYGPGGPVYADAPPGFRQGGARGRGRNRSIPQDER